MHSISIRVVSVQLIDHPRVLAQADLEIGNFLLLKGVTLIQDHPDLPIRLQAPQVSWKDESSARHYANPCKIRKPLRQLIVKALVARLQREGVAL